MANKGVWIFQFLLIFLITGAVSRKIRYTVWTKTKNKIYADSDATIKLQIHGAKGKTHYFVLDSPVDDFKLGSINSFTVWKKDVGNVKSISVYNKGEVQGSGWCIEWIYVYSFERKLKYRFYLDNRCWLDKKKTRIMYKLVQSRLLTTAYRVITKTWNGFGTSSDATIFLKLVGLRRSKTSWYILNTSYNDFEKGETDVFNLITEDIGDKIVRIVLYNAGDATYSKWCFQEIRILDRTHFKEFLFRYSNCWLKADHFRHLFPVVTYDLQKITCFVTTKTANYDTADSNANIYITFVGTNGESITFLLLETGGNTFERGARNDFALETEDIGQITEIKLYNDGTGNSPNWCFEEIHILVQGRSEEYKFIPGEDCWLNGESERSIGQPKISW